MRPVDLLNPVNARVVNAAASSWTNQAHQNFTLSVIFDKACRFLSTSSLCSLTPISYDGDRNLAQHGYFHNTFHVCLRVFKCLKSKQGKQKRAFTWLKLAKAFWLTMSEPCWQLMGRPGPRSGTVHFTTQLVLFSTGFHESDRTEFVEDWNPAVLSSIRSISAHRLSAWAKNFPPFGHHISGC